LGLFPLALGFFLKLWAFSSSLMLFPQAFRLFKKIALYFIYTHYSQDDTHYKWDLAEAYTNENRQ
jgi:hypothetical protein